MVDLHCMTWRAKSGSALMRLHIFKGQSSSRGERHFVPIIVVRLKGRTGFRLLEPVERLELGYGDWRKKEATILYEFDLTWTIVDEDDHTLAVEADLKRLVGRNGCRLLGPAPWQFLASVFPIKVKRLVSRTRDGLETRRALSIINALGHSIMISAAKRPGREEALTVRLFGNPAGAYEALTKIEHAWRFDTTVELETPIYHEADDETAFRTIVGPRVVGALSRADYRHIIPQGDNAGAPTCEIWGDGYDHGAVPAPPAPPVPAPPAPRPVNTAAAEAPTPVPASDTALPAEVADEPDDVEELDSDPLFGSF